MELKNKDVVILKNGITGCVVDDIICIARRNKEYIPLESYINNGPCCNIAEDYDIEEVLRLEDPDDERDIFDELEYKTVWKRKYPRYAIKDGDTVVTRNEKRLTVAGQYFISNEEKICWDDFDDWLLADNRTSEGYDVLEIYRDGNPIWTQDMMLRWDW